MSESPAPTPPLPPVAVDEFYVTGGTLRPDAPSYVERRADADLYEGLLRGEFCYVLTSRQMGKSSLMVRVVQRLRQEGVAVAVLDLTAIGQNLTLEQWYDGLIARLGQQLKLEDELLEFWEAHPEWGPLQRWISALEQVVLTRLPGKVVIFVDEIDMVRSLSFSTDEFFAGIRECCNRRAHDPAFQRLAFGLLGVATPTDLIRDTRMTPFNVGRRIELNDFTGQEAMSLARGLGPNEPTAWSLLTRVLYWTGGHPYLTQRLCRALAEGLRQPSKDLVTGQPVPPALPTPDTVDRLAGQLFLSSQARDRDDNLIFVRERLLRSDVDVAGLLYLYRKLHTCQPVPDNETNPLVSVLRLSGIAKGANGSLQIRNQIYRRVFDLHWIQTNMPEAEVRRQRRAVRRGMIVGFGIALILLLAYLVFGPVVARYQHERRAYLTVHEMASAYRQVQSYRDTFETTLDIGVGGTTVPVTSSGSLIFEKPNRVNLSLKSALIWPRVEVRLLSDGRQSCLYAPTLGQCQVLEPGLKSSPFDLPDSTPPQLGALRLLPVYRLLLGRGADADFLRDALNLRFTGTATLEGEPVNIVTWEQDAATLLGALGPTNLLAGKRPIAITAWVNRTNSFVVRIRMDLSPWAGQLFESVSDAPLTGLVLTESHRVIETLAQPESPARFSLAEAAEARKVPRLELPPPDFSTLAASRRQFSRLIPPRLPEATPNLIDLTKYYNAALSQTWHPGLANNSLNVLPPGLLQLGGSVFDVRGIVQLSGRELERVGGRYPRQMDGIRIGQLCRELQFLHATGWRAPDGTRVGTYVVHYADARESSIPIIYGQDVRDWNTMGDPSVAVKHSSIVWCATNSAGLYVRLFKTAWVNPTPETEIASLDYLSAMADAAPFLVSITAEP
jgi:hypothetical protein